LRAGQELWVEADAARLQQVLLNLLTNAQTYADASPVIDVRVYAEDGHVTVEIRDEGPGIPPPVLRTLFARRKPGAGLGVGLGLGLYISHEIMVALGGTLTARSALGVGTTMVLRLPSIDRPADPDSGPADRDSA
jgi:signal transduction histidine kinase